MKKCIFSDDIDERFIRMQKKQIYTFCGKSIQIECVSGKLWITWPDGMEAVLTNDKSVSIEARGKSLHRCF